MLILVIGIVLIFGYVSGYLAEKIGFPKVTGYLVAGILFNPGLGFIPENIPSVTEPVTDICLAFITFEVGTNLSLNKLRSRGRGILTITVFESMGAFLAVFTGLMFLAPVITKQITAENWVALAIPFSILTASLASPTDPSATLAVMHEYRAKGIVSETIMGAAAFDDAITLIMYSVGYSVVTLFMGQSSYSAGSIILNVITSLFGAITVGVILGLMFNKAVSFFKIANGGQLIVLVIGFLAMTFGISSLLSFDEFLSTLVVGVIVSNFNREKHKILSILEQYTEEFIFIFFFVLTAMHFNFNSLIHSLYFIGLFVIFRAAGKFTGTYIGSRISRFPGRVRKYAFAGLIPQGGIVLGLALTVEQDSQFSAISNLLIGTIMGATIIHEIVGPFLAKWALLKSGEISNHTNQ